MKTAFVGNTSHLTIYSKKVFPEVPVVDILFKQLVCHSVMHETVTLY